METMQKPVVTLRKYGTRAYHVFFDGEHWGNVCGYDDGWTAVWFTQPDSPETVGGRLRDRITRQEAVSEVKIQTGPDRFGCGRRGGR